MKTENYKPKDLVHYLDIAYVLLYQAHLHQQSELAEMQQELIAYRNHRAALISRLPNTPAVPEAIDAAIAASILGISLHDTKAKTVNT